MLVPTIAFIVVLAGPCVPGAPESTSHRTSAIRSVEGWVNTLISDGLRRSPTFARLASTIAGRHGIVYVEALTVLKAGLVGAVPALVRRAPDGTRYTRVWLMRDKPPDQLIETLGHELQHVIELLDRGDQAPADLPRGTTRRRDWMTGVSIIETEAARHAGQAVHFELLTRGTSGPAELKFRATSGPAELKFRATSGPAELKLRATSLDTPCRASLP